MADLKVCTTFILSFPRRRESRLYFDVVQDFSPAGEWTYCEDVEAEREGN